MLEVVKTDGEVITEKQRSSGDPRPEMYIDLYFNLKFKLWKLLHIKLIIQNIIQHGFLHFKVKKRKFVCWRDDDTDEPANWHWRWLSDSKCIVCSTWRRIYLNHMHHRTGSDDVTAAPASPPRRLWSEETLNTWHCFILLTNRRFIFTWSFLLLPITCIYDLHLSRSSAALTAASLNQMYLFCSLRSKCLPSLQSFWGFLLKEHKQSYLLMWDVLEVSVFQVFVCSPVQKRRFHALSVSASDVCCFMTFHCRNKKYFKVKVVCFLKSDSIVHVWLLTQS